ncbi:putative mannosyl-3-phosphoglycerate phosphatase (mngB-like) [Enterobacter cancerogenus]|uniref:mannosyl-3-phosphoglycerate phosphatase-related protein n=1 Tax=Enterobacter cancerogenus TaxID=69218 RepID=UPI001927E1D5|nr:mannosyl-3-phosphoglycerate phosphatase-related protein [Enterobacter cancerogenus]CAD5356610.1 putative mannosyl-3-phosphoglycerate phosphatase (mngB-like) [Enterobacter cancerogenus]
MISLQETLVIITDLDGTLLDIHTYDWQPAKPWLETLRDRQIPVVLCSSKTAAEMADIQQELGLDGLPLIAENGAVIQPDVRWEDTSRSLSGMAHQDIAQCLARIRASRQYKFTTFDDVDVQTIGEWTGLTRLRATLACKHEASVTLIWRDSDAQMAQFEEELAQHGLKLVQGARFWHVLDVRCGKDVAARWLVEQYRQHENIEPTTLGLGDGPNDAPLLENVDYAVVIKGINRQGITLVNDSPERVYRTQHAGPEGWREGLDHFLS